MKRNDVPARPGTPIVKRPKHQRPVAAAVIFTHTISPGALNPKVKHYIDMFSEHDWQNDPLIEEINLVGEKVTDLEIKLLMGIVAKSKIASGVKRVNVKNATISHLVMPALPRLECLIVGGRDLVSFDLESTMPKLQFISVHGGDDLIELDIEGLSKKCPELQRFHYVDIDSDSSPRVQEYDKPYGSPTVRSRV